MSILKLTGTSLTATSLHTSFTGTSLHSISRSRNSCGGARMVSTLNKSAYAPISLDESIISPFSSSPSPSLMLSPRSRNKSYELYSFAEKRVLSIPKSKSGSGYATRVVGSSQGWLACYNHRRREAFLYNPLSGRRVNLPPIHNLSIPESDLRSAWGSIQKIIISCSDPESEECRAIMLVTSINGLAFCCPGRSATEWTIIQSPQAKPYQDFQDFVYCEPLLFSIKYTNEFEAWDLQNPLSPSLVWSSGVHEPEEVGSDSCGQSNFWGKWGRWEEEEWWSMKREYLVVSQQGELFIVRRYMNPYMLPDGSCASLDTHENPEWYPTKTINFNVHKIVREGNGWKRVEMDGHLDDLVMFIGEPSDGMAMPAADGFQPNSICFTDDAYRAIHGHGTDNGIFDYKKKTLSSCYYPIDYQSLKKKILPPPLWLANSQLSWQ